MIQSGRMRKHNHASNEFEAMRRRVTAAPTERTPCSSKRLAVLSLQPCSRSARQAPRSRAEHAVDDTPPLVELGFARTSEPQPPDPFVFPRADADPATTITPVLLREIIGWLTQNFDLPASDELPTVAFTTKAHMNALRYRGLLNHDQQRTAGSGSDTVARL